MYRLLQDYKDYLLKTYSRETANTYVKRLTVILQDQNIQNTVAKLDVNIILTKLAQKRYKHHFSQAKNALLHFCDFQNIQLPHETHEQIKQLEKATKKKRRKLVPVTLTYIKHKIRYIKNKRLKLSFEVMLATGLRVAELTSIKPTDCFIEGGFITLVFIGKGGKGETAFIDSIEHPKLYDKLVRQIQTTKDNKKIFYSGIYLQSKAKALGFKCHDLRRAFAKLEYKKTGSKQAVMKKLRHSKVKTTNIYLRSKVKI